MDNFNSKCKQERSLTVHRYPLCRIGMDIDIIIRFNTCGVMIAGLEFQDIGSLDGKKY